MRVAPRRRILATSPAGDIRHDTEGACIMSHVEPMPVSRRAALRGLAGGVVAVLTAAPLKSLRAQSAAATVAATADSGGRLLVFESDANGFNTKTIFYDTGRQVVAFDTQFTPAYAKQAIAALRAASDRPIAYAVVTHPNPDKFNGLPAFQAEGATSVASRATADAMPGVNAYKKAFFVGAGMFTAATYPALGAIDQSFSGATTVDLGSGKSVQLRELPRPGVSSTQTVAFIPELNVLVVGDLVHHQVHAWLEGGIVDGKATPTLDGWIADLETLQAACGGASEPTVYGGRGEAAPLMTAVTDQIAYLRRADQLVTDYVAALGDRKAELQGDGASAHYAALTKQFEAVFPAYGLSYLIQYGVYGLVNAKAYG
jgi:glyoxylase-like metal-dependent hydrolase (beta-lactamase superfamily II)